MKKIFFSLTMMLLMFCFVLTGCATVLLKPELTDNIDGNGGMVVRKGDYVYFANGVEAVDAENTNVEYAGLYMAKHDNGSLTDVKRIAGKIAGFENSALFIYNDYLFFATPSTRTSSDSQKRTDLIDFYRVNLDGTGLKKIYTTEKFKSGKFGFTVIDGKSYIIVFDGSELYKLDVEGKKISLQENVTGAVVPTAENINNNFYEADEFNSYAYITKERTEEQFPDAGAKGNCLYRVNLKTGDEEILYMSAGQTLTLLNAKNNRLFYSRTYSAQIADEYTFSTDGITRASFITNEKQLKSDKIVPYSVCRSEGVDLGIVYTSNDKLYLKKTGETTVNQLISSTVNIMFTKGSYVYYSKDSAIYRIDCNSLDKKEEKLTKNKSIEAKYAFADSNYFYFFAQYEYPEGYEPGEEGLDTKFYMHRTDLKTVERATQDEEIFVEYMGIPFKLKDKDQDK